MSRDFDGVDDIISKTAITTFSGSYTMAAWINADSAGETANGNIMWIDTASVTERRVFQVYTGIGIQAWNDFTTSGAYSASVETLTAGVWYCVVCTYTSSDKTLRLYYGSLSAAMAQVTYSPQTAGVGSALEGATRIHVGNKPDATETFDGKIEHAVCDNRIWTLDEMEAFRQGQRPINTGSMIFYWPLDSPTAAQAEDLSGNGYHGTVTGAIAAEGPPVATKWGSAFGMTFTAAAAKVPVFMHSYRRRRAA